MKKVLLIGDSVYPDSEGGSHRHIYELAVNLIDKGYKVIVLVPNPDGKFKYHEKASEGFEYYRYYRHTKNKLLSFFDYTVGAYSLYRRLRKKEIKFDVIHSHWAISAYLIFKFGKNEKKIHTMHGPCFAEYSIEKKNTNVIIKRPFLILIRFMEQAVFNYADHIITASNYMREKAICFFGNGEKINIIPVATNVEKFCIKMDKKVAKRKACFSEDEICLLTVRRLSRRMGIDILIKAIASVKKFYPNIKLYIGGKGDYREALEEIVTQNDLVTDVNFIGYIPEKSLSTIYEAADVFVIPSIDLEGFGLVSTEAMACGTMVIGTPVGETLKLLVILIKVYYQKQYQLSHWQI